MSERLKTRAALRLMDAVRGADADRRTSIADARAALCLASGTNPDDISRLGYDTSDRAYQIARTSWREYAANHWSEDYVRPKYEEAHALWVRLRPDLATGDDWLAGINLGGGAR